MKSSILHQNESRTFSIVDIPHSIRDGQNSNLILICSSAPESPYPSTEPKGSKRDRLFNSIPKDEQIYHEENQQLISAALRNFKKSSIPAKWCLPRVNGEAEGFVVRGTISPTVPLCVLAPGETIFRTLEDLDSVIYNPNASFVNLFVGADKFHIPPFSVFLWTTIEHGQTALPEAMEALLVGTDNAATERKCFDLILLDPPWANRSVRRGGFYSTVENQDTSPFEMVLPSIKNNLAEPGIVAVWITNKAAIRVRVLVALEGFGLRLFEEWVWAKVTTDGDPVTALGGIWRKPYEILLLFRQNHDSVIGPEATIPLQIQSYETRVNRFQTSYRAGQTAGVQRRVIVAVPDIHSRKPCIKSLIEPYLPRPTYRALEIFARNLTAGWWSWGDEVLKYQHESCWKQAL